MSLDPGEFRRVMGHFASGVTVVTSREPDGSVRGLTASAVASVSLHPPLALVCVDHSADSHDAIVRAGAPWRMLPTNFPPWEAVYQQTQRWRDVGVFEAMVHDLRTLLRWLQDRNAQPTAAILEDVFGWDSTRIRMYFAGHGFALREWDKMRTDTVTLCAVEAAPALAARQVA